jgi:hypothetical protein
LRPAALFQDLLSLRSQEQYDDEHAKLFCRGTKRIAFDMAVSAGSRTTRQHIVAAVSEAALTNRSTNTGWARNRSSYIKDTQMFNLRSLSLSAALGLAVLGVSGGVSSANAQSVQPRPATGFSRVYTELGNLLPTPREATSRPAQNGDLLTVPTAKWGNVEISRKVGDCGLSCRSGSAE